MDQSQFGVENLTQKLTELLFSLIKDNLFHIESEVKKLRGATICDLNKIGDVGPDSQEKQLAFICEKIETFKHNFQSVISGHVESIDGYDFNNLGFSGSTITQLFRDLYKKQLETKPSLSMNDIETVYNMTCGNRLITFVPNGTIHIFLKRYLTELNDPAEKLVDNVIKVLFTIVNETVQKLFNPFQPLIQQIRKIAH